MRASNPRVGQRVEIAGVAGTGKSTLRKLLCDGNHDGWVVAESMHARHPAQLPYLSAGLHAVLPLVAASARRGARPEWQDVKDAAYVTVWHRYLAAHADAVARTVLLDQGPLFALARLRWVPSPLTAAPEFASWWQDELTLWARELDGVVWLDAPDDVLIARINTRSRFHQIKNRPTDEACSFLGESRWTLAAVVDAVSAASGVPILAFDTATTTPEQAARRVESWAGASVGAI